MEIDIAKCLCIENDKLII